MASLCLLYGVFDVTIVEFLSIKFLLIVKVFLINGVIIR